MIDDREIEEQFHSIFKFSNRDNYIQVNSENGEVTVFGSIVCNGSKITHLPFTIASVTGHMIVKDCPNLTSLKGFPRKVGTDFHVYYTGITNLVGSPDLVMRGQYIVNANQLTSLDGLTTHLNQYGISVTNNPLTSLDGIYEHIPSVTLSYDPNLPMLKLLMAQHSYIVSDDEDDSEFLEDQSSIEKINSIIEKWRGHGAAGILQCASDLNEHGFEGNAEW